MVVLWPMPVYFLPLLVRALNQPSEGAVWSRLWGFVSGTEAPQGVGGVMIEPGSSVSVTVLLCVLATHAVVLTCSESFFAHMLTRTPVLEGLHAADGDDEGQEL